MLTENDQMQDYTLTTRLLIACGAIGSMLFIVAFMIESAIRPDYSAWHYFVSDLSVGSQGWMQIANFLTCGVLMCCFALGLRRVFRSGKGAFWGPLLFGIFGVSLIIAGIFIPDPSLGYSVPGITGLQTWHGTIHGANAPLAFGSLAIAIFVLARRFAADPRWRGWTLYSLATGVIVVGLFIATLTVAALDKRGVLPGSPTGLLERIVIIIGWVWITLLSTRLLMQMRPSTSVLHSVRADYAN